jgi:predicted dehydrogenase
MVFRIGIVGAGFLTRQSLLPAIAATPDLALAAVLDSDPAALKAVAGDWPDAWCGTDPDGFFATGLDGVHVATPNHLHADYACRALAAGVPTLVDKPLADTVEAGRRILDAAGTTPAMVGYMARHNAYNRATVDVLRSGALGEPRSMTAAHFGHRVDDWRNRRTDSGLGSLGDLAIYPLVTAADVLGGEPEAVQATSYPSGDPDRTDIYAEATIWYTGGAHLHLESSFTERPGVGVSRYTVVCAAGLLVVRDSWAMDSGGSVLVCEASGRRFLRPEPVDPYVAQYRSFARCAAGEPVPPQAGLARALHHLWVLHELERSAADGGARLSLNGGPRP